MSQIKIVNESLDFYDLQLDADEADHLALDDTFRTAILISILTDRRCEPSEALDPTDLGGFWGDTYASVPGDFVGSRLWTLAGRAWDSDTLALADGYVRECLQWMVDDGVISDIHKDIAVELEFKDHSLYGRVVIAKPGTSVPAWDVAWSRTLG